MLMLQRHACMDTWDIPYQRRALPMLGGSVAAPLGQCTDNFSTEDSSECVEVEHDTSTGAGTCRTRVTCHGHLPQDPST